MHFSQSIAVGLAAVSGAHAWGQLGHATVAYIAQQYVTSDTASWAQGLLNDTSSSYMASIASWADDYRATAAGKWSAPFHFIDAQDSPPKTCNVDYKRDCGSSGCSLSAIANYTQRVSDDRLDAEQRFEAVKFLIHFIGDLTQPLHDEAYEVGGNDIKVTFAGYKDNLHADWDTYIPEKLVGGGALSDAQTWANSLVKDIKTGKFKDQAASWTKGDSVDDAIGTTTRWATDANAFVCSVVMPDGAAALETGDLYPTYYNSVVPTVELQIAKGGYRLGNWLNMIHQSKVAKSSKRGSRELPDLTGRDLLADLGPATRAQLARAAMGGECCHSH